ncbi:MAG: hypothetical protein A2Y40_08255 [Candidatus Margulisbacteria bacterium GWF2_35_9]|nr:MAG: hypothetical protein A2Y40_08255 [Candidatus Margulisbacteria bacterium GWF2_35_9]
MLNTLHNAFSDLSYSDTYTQAQKCTRCPLATTRTKVVFNQGPVPCKLMLIGEAPGADEDIQGIPFVGRAGQLLTKMLEAVEIFRPNDIYITNTLKCRPPNNRTPLQSEIDYCQDFLLKQISEVQPRILILVGSPAMKTILHPDESISKIRGKWFNLTVDYMSESLRVMTIFHPSYLLRNASKEQGSPKWLTWMDLKEIKKTLDTL